MPAKKKAKKAKAKEAPAAQASKKASGSAPKANGEGGSIASYFKAIFKENPKLLDELRANILQPDSTDRAGQHAAGVSVCVFGRHTRGARRNCHRCGHRDSVLAGR